MIKRIAMLLAVAMVGLPIDVYALYHVQLDKNGGSGGTDSVTIGGVGDSMPHITVPTRRGYTFVGYYGTFKEVTGDPAYNPQETRCYYDENGNGVSTWRAHGGLNAEPYVLYAKWKSTSGDSGGGSSSGGGSGSGGGSSGEQHVWRQFQWKDPDTGYVWTYCTWGYSNNLVTPAPSDEVTIGYDENWPVAVSPEPTGALTIPSYLPKGKVTRIGVSAFSSCHGLTSITIPDSVTTIWDTAFAYCGLRSITIPDSVTKIGWGAFEGCLGLKSVTIPDSVKSLGDRAFYECTGLTSVTLSTTGRDSFAYCSSLTNVTLCNGVKGIAAGAFRNCSRLANVTIPDSVTGVGEGAFKSCSGLVSVTIPASVTWIGDEAFRNCSGLASVTIPGGVTSVGARAFFECSGLTNVTICNGAMGIESSAFSSCSSLMSIGIPSSVTSIGDNAFYGCGALANIYVSQGDVDRVSGLLTDSGFDVSGVNFIETIDCPVIFDPQGGTGGWASVMATYGFAMPPIIIPTRAGYAFGGYWTVAYGRGVQYYGMYGKGVRAWDKTSETTLFAKWVGPSVITFDQQGGSGGTLSVTAVYGNAMPFITVPTRNGYTFGGYYSSGSGAGTQYYNESGESALVWDRETATTLYAKWGYKVSLDQQDGEGGTSSVVAAYDGAMPTISVPNRTGYTFCGYWSGKNGEGTQYYTASGKSAHDWDKENASTLYAKWQVNQYTVTFDANGGTGGGISVTQDYGTTLVAPTVTRENYIHTGWTPDFTGTVPASNVVYVAQWCCYFAVDKNADGTITINGVNFLPDEDYEIPSVIDGSLVTCIASNAFKDCTILRSIKIPDSVATIEAGAFSGCSGLEEITLPFVGACRGNSGSSESLFGYIFGASSYTGGTQTRQYYYSSSSTYYIPSNLRIVFVTDETVLGDGAFSGCSGLTSVTIPNGVTSIGRYAFENCSGFTSVTIPNSVTSIGDFAFYGSGLTSVTIPDSVTSIGISAFYNCSGLTSVTIPDSVTSIGAAAFSGIMSIDVQASNPNYLSVNGLLLSKDGKLLVTAQHSLASATIPNSVTKIVDYAFENCSGLTNVTIPASVTSIGYWVFKNCSRLTSVTIPDSVTSIGSQAFSCCSGLTSVTIPCSVTSIGEWAFYDCSWLAKVYVSIGDVDRVKGLMTGSGFDVSGVSFIEVPHIVFVTNAEDVNVCGRYVNLGRAVGKLPAPLRAGYEFAGWWTSPDGGTQIAASTVVTGNMTCYAHWTANKYTVTFDANGGSGGKSVTQDCGTSLSAPTVTREGYAFAGWSPSVPATVPAANVTYTAQWKLNQYKVTFDANGGSGGTSVTQNYGTALSVPTVVREGYTFAGWSPDIPATGPYG